MNENFNLVGLTALSLLYIPLLLIWALTLGPDRPAAQENRQTAPAKAVQPPPEVRQL